MMMKMNTPTVEDEDEKILLGLQRWRLSPCVCNLESNSDDDDAEPRNWFDEDDEIDLEEGRRWGDEDDEIDLEEGRSWGLETLKVKMKMMIFFEKNNLGRWRLNFF